MMRARMAMSLAGLAVACALGLCACNPRAPAPPAGDPTAPAASREPTDAALLSAAEAFEALTHDAYSLSPARLEAQTGTAAGVAAGVRDKLPAAAQSDMDAQVTRLQAAQVSNDRPEVALSAVEIYRLMLSGVRHPGKAPAGVGLLDYAGLRYDAGRRASPSRWDDMTAAVIVARDQWLAVSPQVKDPALLGQMDRAIADMSAAVDRRDEKAAARAVRAQLDLVDGLEAYFNRI